MFDLPDEEILPLSKEHVFYTWSAQAKVNPIALKRAQGVYFWDLDDRRYLDFNSMTMCVNIGHGNERVIKAMQDQAADMAMAAAPEGDGAVRPQPVFCLLKTELLESLVKFTQGGGRKIDAWTAQHRCAIVPFDLPGDSPQAFANANTLAELQQLEAL